MEDIREDRTWRRGSVFWDCLRRMDNVWVRVREKCAVIYAQSGEHAFGDSGGVGKKGDRPTSTPRTSSHLGKILPDPSSRLMIERSSREGNVISYNCCQTSNGLCSGMDAGRLTLVKATSCTSLYEIALYVYEWDKAGVQSPSFSDGAYQLGRVPLSVCVIYVFSVSATSSVERCSVVVSEVVGASTTRILAGWCVVDV